LLFSRDDNAIARYQLTESPARDILYISPQNLAWQNNISFQTTLPFTVNKWWNMSYGFAGGPRQYNARHLIVYVPVFGDRLLIYHLRKEEN
jgi:hypothetical protein